MAGASAYSRIIDFARIREICDDQSGDEWIRKLWYIYTMEYYSAIKKNTFDSVLMRWMELESIQSEVSQKEKHQYSMLLLLSRLSRVQLCATPEMAAHQAPPSMVF